MARPSTGLVVVLIWCMYLRYSGAQTMKEEDSELEEHLNHVNKRAVTTVETKHGEVYNCIEFQKQPAFDHPLYKNYTFHIDQIKPTSYLKEEEKNEEKKNKEAMIDKVVKEMWVNGKGCPSGTVPIRKQTASGFKDAKLAAQVYGQRTSPMTVQNPGLHYAVLRTKAPGPYYGGGMSASTYNPQVSGSQFSGARLRLQNGPESIEVGWMVNPSLNGDSRTHVFAHTNAGKSNCFNTHCPGIITVRPDLPVDFVLEPTSTTGSKGQRFVQHFFIYKDEANGNWFVALGDEGNVIGFWPQSVFTTMANSANYVEWGGMVYSPPNVPSPPMGSGGSKLHQDTKEDAYCKYVSFINKDHKLVDATDVEQYSDVGTYQVRDEGYVNDHFRHLLFFGGFGGYTGN